MMLMTDYPMAFLSLVAIFLSFHKRISVMGSLWSDWWMYHGASGPEFWGTHNPEWSLCSKGRLQSPIDIAPKQLIYDQNLSRLHLSNLKVDGMLMNTGHDLTLLVEGGYFTFTGGPLSYNYTVHQIKMHLGSMDNVGSEHTFAGKAFPLELQIIGYNTDLYNNATEAVHSPHGLAAIAVLGTLGHDVNEQFDNIVRTALAIKVKGMKEKMEQLSLTELMPRTDTFITYEGSITQPGCHETVTWIILNKPLLITQHQIMALRQLTNVTEQKDGLMENNFRPSKPVNGRLVRTNILSNSQEDECHARKITFYEINTKFTKS